MQVAVNSQKCPRCSIPLKPLFTGWFCPNDCDRQPTAVGPDPTYAVITSPHGLWRMQRVDVGSKIPEWATRGWNLYKSSGQPYTLSTVPFNELIDAWQRRITGYLLNATPGWELDSNTKSGFDSRAAGWLVFGLLPPAGP